MGQLHDLLVRAMSLGPDPVSQRQVAARLGVAPSTIDNWRYPRELIAKPHLVAIARLTGATYAEVRDALLADIGYLHEDQGPLVRPDSRRASGVAARAAEAMAEARAAVRAGRDEADDAAGSVSECGTTGQHTA